MTDQRITVTQAQKDYLAGLEIQANQTRGQFDAAMTVILRGAGVTVQPAAMQFDGLEIVVTLPDEAPDGPG